MDHLTKHYPIPADFNSVDMKALKRRALLGDGGAATQLQEIYSNCLGHYLIRGAPRPNVSEAECEKALYYWVEIAAVNGSLSGIMQHYNFLTESKDCQAVYRARYWLNKIPRQHMLEEPWISESERQMARENACGWGNDDNN